jgi:DNA-binding transcriptional MerR regulator
MAHEIAKLVLERSESFIERSEAIKTALSMGMPLNEIEEYLDWLAVVRAQKPAEPKGQKSTPQDSADS